MSLGAGRTPGVNLASSSRVWAAARSRVQRWAGLRAYCGWAALRLRWAIREVTVDRYAGLRFSNRACLKCSGDNLRRSNHLLAGSGPGGSLARYVEQLLGGKDTVGIAYLAILRSH